MFLNLNLGIVESAVTSLGEHLPDLGDGTELGALIMKAEGLPLDLVLAGLPFDFNKVRLCLLLHPLRNFGVELDKADSHRVQKVLGSI